jgi:hypothetical protein
MIRAALKACREMQFEIDRSAMAKFLIRLTVLAPRRSEEGAKLRLLRL